MVAFGEVLLAEREAVFEEKLIDLEVELGGLLLRGFELEVGERLGAGAVGVLEGGAGELGLQGLGDECDVVFEEEGGLFLLEGSADALGFGEGGEVGPAPEGREVAVAGVDERLEGERAGGIALEQGDIVRVLHDGGKLVGHAGDGVLHGAPFGGVGRGGGLAQDGGQGKFFAEGKPVLHGEALEHVADGAGDHEGIPGGDEPFAGFEGLPGLLVGVAQEAQLLGAVLEKPQGDVPQGGGEAAVCPGLPHDLVHGVFHTKGIHHLVDEQACGAGEVGIGGVGGGEMVVEVLEGLLMGGGLRVFLRVLDREDLPAVACGGLFALEGDGLECGVALFDDVERLCDGAVVAVAKLVELRGEALRGEVARGVEARVLQPAGEARGEGA